MKLQLRDRQRETADIWSYCFVSGELKEWLPGQSIRLELPRPTWGVDERRFSIASAPQEGHIKITTRLGDSPFKQSLALLKPGDGIQGYGVEGSFVWGNEDRPRLMLAGGIGITPFRAMLAAQAAQGTPARTTLLYGAHEQPAVFEQELLDWQAHDETLHVHLIRDKRIEFIQEATLPQSWLEHIVYVSGPEAMVDALSAALLERGLPEQQLRRDWFTGLQQV